jgi:hypothetical protein
MVFFQNQGLFVRFTRSSCKEKNCKQALVFSSLWEEGTLFAGGFVVAFSFVSVVFSLPWDGVKFARRRVCKKGNKEKGSIKKALLVTFSYFSKKFTQKSVGNRAILIALIFVLIYNRICVIVAFLSQDKKTQRKTFVNK